MKKKKSKLIILLGVLLVLIIAYTAVGRVNNKSDVKKQTVLLNYNAEDIVKLEWVNSGETIVLNNENGQWKLERDDKFPVDNESVGRMVEKAASLSASRELDNENISDYGFSENSDTVKITDKDGKVRKVTVGGLIDMTSENYIYLDDDKTKIYTVGSSFKELFDKSKNDILMTERIYVEGDVVSFKIENSGEGLDIKKNDEGKWTDGENILDDSRVNTVLSDFTIMQWLECYSYDADDAMKEEKGFKDPSATVTIASDIDEVKILFGISEGDKIYAKLDGSNMIYLVSNEIERSINMRSSSLAAVE